VATAESSSVERVDLDEERFRWMHNEDAMATEKLAEGIRTFHADSTRLRAFVSGSG
jgi:transaldolase